MLYDDIYGHRYGANESSFQNSGNKTIDMKKLMSKLKTYA